jgi:hypothetical protein
MLGKKTIALALLWALGCLACTTTTPEKSTGSNWLDCDDDADCAAVAEAICGAEGYCVDAVGDRVTVPVNTGGSGQGASSVTGTTGGAGGADAAAGAGGTTMGGGPAMGGVSGIGGSSGAGGVPPTSVVVVDCYSPGQNLHTAYEPGAVGCKCPTDAPDLCVSNVALTCREGRWQAVEDGACARCWTPDEPYSIVSNPDGGCPCDTEGETACSRSEPTGTHHLVCQDGKWTVTGDWESPCDCTSDAQCGFQGLCLDGRCAPGVCEVDSVRYPIGKQGIPDPLSCHVCECAAEGFLSCATTPCPTTYACPEGTTAASACLICGDIGGCSLRRTGCLETCHSNDDCAQYYLPLCHEEEHVCMVPVCI